jgi:hypothetical protein
MTVTPTPPCREAAAYLTPLRRFLDFEHRGFRQFRPLWSGCDETDETQNAKRKTQNAKRKTQYAIRNTQNAIRNTQYAIRNTQNSKRKMQDAKRMQNA